MNCRFLKGWALYFILTQVSRSTQHFFEMNAIVPVYAVVPEVASFFLLCGPEFCKLGISRLSNFFYTFLHLILRKIQFNSVFISTMLAQ